MNIQIFGKTKCFDTKKAERYFKERRIKYQFIDLAKYGMSKGEYNSVKSALGGIHELVDQDAKDYHLIKYLAYESDIDVYKRQAIYRNSPVHSAKGMPSPINGL